MAGVISRPAAKRLKALLALATGLYPAAVASAEGTALPLCVIAHELTPNTTATGQVYTQDYDPNLKGVFQIKMKPFKASRESAGAMDDPSAMMVFWFHWSMEEAHQYRFEFRKPFPAPADGSRPSYDVSVDIGGNRRDTTLDSYSTEWGTLLGWNGGERLRNVKTDPTLTFQRSDADEPAITFTYSSSEAREAFEISPAIFGTLVDHAEKGECQIAQQTSPGYDDYYGDSDCFLTTAACDGVGLADDCWELRTLRRFRDGWLARQPGGAEDIARYYREAPAIAEKLRSDPEALLKLYWTRIIPSALAAQFGANHLARRLYTGMMHDLLND